jgi:uncharacterized membrane protein YqaE (UPF0057 family)
LAPRLEPGPAHDRRDRNPVQARAFHRWPATGRSPAFRKSDRAPMDPIRIILAVLLPPLGMLGVGFGRNILLVAYVPGIVDAVRIIARR